MKFVAVIMVALTMGFPVSATTNIADLTVEEQTAHRLFYCKSLTSLMSKSDIRHPDLWDLTRLLAYAEPYKSQSRFSAKVNSDLKVSVLTGAFVITQPVVNSCYRDVQQIARDTYVPHFNYIEDTQ